MSHFLNPTLCILYSVMKFNSLQRIELHQEFQYYEGNLTSLSHFRIWFKMVYLVSKLTMTFNFLFPQFPTCDLPHGEPRAILSFLFAFSKSQMRIVQTGTALNRQNLSTQDVPQPRCFREYSSRSIAEFCYDLSILSSGCLISLMNMNTCFYASHFSLREGIQLIILHQGFSVQNMGGH